MGGWRDGGVGFAFCLLRGLAARLALLARLDVDYSHQGNGAGASLLVI
jgi:hypothetical protein